MLRTGTGDKQEAQVTMDTWAGDHPVCDQVTGGPSASTLPQIQATAQRQPPTHQPQPHQFSDNPVISLTLYISCTKREATN